MDVARLQALPDDDCHILFVSSRTLYLLANYASSEVNFLGRYAESFTTDGYYQPVQPGGALEIVKNDIANRFGVEVVPVCDELVAAIGDVVAQLGLINTNIGEINVELGGIQGVINNTTQMTGCCTPYGPALPPTAPDLEDEVTGDPPEDWATWALYYTYKCKAANRIADEWISTTASLGTLSGAAGAIGAIALALFLNTSLMGGILVGLIALGFSAASAAAIIIAALIAIVVGGSGLLAYFIALSTEMETNKESLVCALYAAQSPAEATTALVDFTADVAADLTYDPADDDALFQEQLGNLADALFNEEITNTLFEENAESDAYTGDVDCADCVRALLIDAVLTTDTGLAIYDQEMHPDMVDYTSYWSNDGDNTWRGCQTPFSSPPPPFPSGNPYTVWLRVRYDYKQPLNRAGWGGVRISQSSGWKFQDTWVHPGDATWKSYDNTFSVDLVTTPGHDEIRIYIENEKNYWQCRNIRVEWVEAP